MNGRRLRLLPGPDLDLRIEECKTALELAHNCRAPKHLIRQLTMQLNQLQAERSTQMLEQWRAEENPRRERMMWWVFGLAMATGYLLFLAWTFGFV